jgi:tRNA (mo5U34)-methyltransferase
VSTAGNTEASVADVRAAIAGVRGWYHSIEVAPGVVTPGLFDLRPIVDKLPWPDIRGKRCLDIGTGDGFFAFELERRGAAEVVATDVAAHEDWDWEPHNRESGVRYFHHLFGPEKRAGFDLVHRLLGSSVRLEQISIHDLAPDQVGEFDVVVCGSLLLHLRDPLGALGAIRSVCRDAFLSTNQVDLVRSVLVRDKPLVRLDGTSGMGQWWLPNAAGHRQMLRASGFAIGRGSRLYSVPFGPAHPARPGTLPSRLRRLARVTLTGNDGVVHHALLARRSAGHSAGDR